MFVVITATPGWRLSQEELQQKVYDEDFDSLYDFQDLNRVVEEKHAERMVEAAKRLES